jgi:hypothetical protein
VVQTLCTTHSPTSLLCPRALTLLSGGLAWKRVLEPEQALLGPSVSTQSAEQEECRKPDCGEPSVCWSSWAASCSASGCWAEQRFRPPTDASLELDLSGWLQCSRMVRMPPVRATYWPPLVEAARRWEARGIQSAADLPVEARRQDPEARAAFAVWHWSAVHRQRPVTGEACDRCGLVTRSWCDSCEVSCNTNPYLEATAVCSVCDTDRLVCHMCHEVGRVYPVGRVWGDEEECAVWRD